jgi:hypothetical protein
MTITIVPVGQDTLEVSCGGETVTIDISGRRRGSRSDPSPPDEPGDSPDYGDPGVTGIMPYLFKPANQAPAFMAHLESWEHLRQIVSEGGATWQFLERNGPGRIIFVVHRDTGIDIDELRGSLAEIPRAVDVIVALASRSQ